MPRDQESAEQRAARDRHAEHRAGPCEGTRDLGLRIVLVHGVDEPGLERTGVEHAEDALQQQRDGEQRIRVGEQEQHARGDREHSRCGEHRASSERVGQRSRGQFQGERHEALDREDRADLRDREPAFERQQHGHPEGHADRQPAQPGEQEQAALGRGDRARGGRRGLGAHDSSGGSRSIGVTCTATCTLRAAESPSPRRRYFAVSASISSWKAAS
jgi:hypothetical protein